MSTIFDTWTKAAEQKAREYYTLCVARSEARRRAGGPTLEQMYAMYEALAAFDFDIAEEDEIVDWINEELFARGTLEDCVEQQMEGYHCNLHLQLIILPIPLN